MSSLIWPRSSGGHDDFADDMAILDETQAFGSALQRDDLVDHRFDLALIDQLHQGDEIFIVETVRSDDLQLKAPDVPQIFLGVVSRGGAADQQLAATFETL